MPNDITYEVTGTGYEFDGEVIGDNLDYAKEIALYGTLNNEASITKHKKIGEPDKEHFHHQLLKMKFSPRTSVLIIYAINILFSIVSIFYTLGDNQVAMVVYIILMILLLYIVINTDILFKKKKNKK